MKKLKYEILFTILFMTVGIAAVSSNILFSGSTQLASNSDDFLVYFSDVLVNGEQAMSLVQNETSLVFTGEFSAVGDKKEITYDITNASMNYDADIDITCTQSTAYLTITNSFDTDSYLSARSTRTGVLTITLSKSYTGTGLTQDISCTINASAAERNSQGSDVVPEPLINKYAIGTEISIGDEKFNIISDNGDTVSMLAQYNLSPEYVQCDAELYESGGCTLVKFSSDNGWEYTPGPKEIDIRNYEGDTKNYLDTYETYLRESVLDDSLYTDLITLKQLGDLGCDISVDYVPRGDENCFDSSYIDWLVNGWIWTKSAHADDSSMAWIMSDMGVLMDFGEDWISYNEDAEEEYVYGNIFYDINGVRPVVTISKDLCDDLLEGMVFFTVNDTAYKAKEGMTWLEFIDSEYNTGGFYNSYEIVKYPHVGVLDSDGNTVNVNDLIVAGAVYSLSNAYSGGYVE